MLGTSTYLVQTQYFVTPWITWKRPLYFLQGAIVYSFLISKTFFSLYTARFQSFIIMDKTCNAWICKFFEFMSKFVCMIVFFSFYRLMTLIKITLLKSTEQFVSVLQYFSDNFKQEHWTSFTHHTVFRNHCLPWKVLR